MTISGISAASNHVKTQRAQQSTLNSNRGTESVKTLQSAWEKDYDKNAAVVAVFNKRRTAYLNYALNGGRESKMPASYMMPSAKNLQELEESLQINGISKEVDWNRMEGDFKGIGFDVDTTASAITEDDFSNRTNYLASRYVAAEDKIRKSTIGDAQAEQLKKLDEVYQKALNEFAEGYSTIVGSYLEKNGVYGEKDKIYDSIIDGMESKIEGYRAALSGNSALESLKGTQDEWLLDDDAYVSAVLRSSENGSMKAAQPKAADAAYTMEDLDTLGQYVSSLSHMDGAEGADDVLGTFDRDESRLGVEYALLNMKTDKLRNSVEISDTMSELLQRTMNGFMRFYMERIDEKLSECRAKGGAPDDRKGYASLDRSAVWDVYQHTMQEYRNSGDVIKALLSGVKYGSAKTATALLERETYRANNTSYFWTHFFEHNQRRYESPDSSYQKYLAGWRDFEASLSSGEAIRMNLELKGSEYYTAGRATILSKSI